MYNVSCEHLHLSGPHGHSLLLERVAEAALGSSFLLFFGTGSGSVTLYVFFFSSQGQVT